MMAKHLPHVITGESLTHQQNAMKAMIIASFLRTKNFILQRYFHQSSQIKAKFAVVANGNPSSLKREVKQAFPLSQVKRSSTITDIRRYIQKIRKTSYRGRKPTIDNENKAITVI